MLAALRTSGLSNEAIAEALAKEAKRTVPAIQRVSDWITGQRPTPEWATNAAAAHLCQLWELERREVRDAELDLCDARWARRIDPVLGEFYAANLYLPADVRANLCTLKVVIRNAVMERYSIALPGV